MEEHKILVMYVGVAGIRAEDISDFVHKVAEKITPTRFEGEILVIPVQSPDTKIECINPKYVTDEEAIRVHTEQMKTLNEEVQNQIIQLRQPKNE